MGAYLPTALAFVAFQYGGELTERMMEEEKVSSVACMCSRYH